MEQIEKIVEKVVKSFEEKPIATTIKGVVILYVLKEVSKWFKS